MPYPFEDYDAVLKEARSLIQDRDGKGRNEFVPFYQTRLHGAADCLGELWQRVTRMAGSEQIEDWTTFRADAIDAVNEAIHVIMFFDREHTHEKPSAEPRPTPERISIR